MIVDFPSNPSTNDTYTLGGRTWLFNGVGWQIQAGIIPNESISNAMLAGEITDSKLNTLATSGKVANSATTATDANTASSIVARDSSGNFSAGTITASLSGTASNASAVPWSGVSSTPTTLSGYGITDAQPLDADLTAIAGLAGTSGFLKKAAADTWSLDTNTYLTGNQSISITGDASGSGSTSIALTLTNVGTSGTYTKVTTDSKGRITSGTTLGSGDIPSLGNLSNAGAIGSTANLPIITGTSGILQAGSFGTAANTFCQGNDSRLSDARTPTDGSVTNAKVASDAAIADTKLATISTAGKVSGSAITSGTIGGSTAVSTSGNVSTTGAVAVGQSSAASNTKLDLAGTYAQTIVAVGALDIDCSSGNYFTKTISANSTFTFSSVPSSRAYSFTLELTHTSGTVTWPTSVKWPKNTAPTLTTGKTHLFVFVTDDGGSRWRGAALADYDN